MCASAYSLDLPYSDKNITRYEREIARICKKAVRSGDKINDKLNESTALGKIVKINFTVKSFSKIEFNGKTVYIIKTVIYGKKQTIKIIYYTLSKKLAQIKRRNLFYGMIVFRKVNDTKSSYKIYGMKLAASIVYENRIRK